MRPTVNQIEGFLLRNSVNFKKLDLAEHDRITEQWRLAFARDVKSATGQWIYKRFRWHGFSFGYQQSIKGTEALEAYQSQWSAPFFVFDEDGTWSYRCTSNTFPDFTPFGADIYVAHKNMKWTIAFTHEQPDIGPFFAEKLTQPSD